MNDPNVRKIFRHENGTPTQVPSLLDLKVGDHFSMQEPDGSPVRDNEGHEIFKATSLAITNEEGVHMIDTLSVTLPFKLCDPQKTHNQQ